MPGLRCAAAAGWRRPRRKTRRARRRRTRAPAPARAHRMHAARTVIAHQRRAAAARDLRTMLGRAEAGHEIDQDHLAAVALDQLAADHLLAAVVAALHQHLRPHAADQLERRVLLEHHHEIDRFERRQHLGARVHVLHRPSLALEPLHRRVAVEPDHQPVAGGARLGQQLDVAGMQEIEAAVGEADAQALRGATRRAARRAPTSRTRSSPRARATAAAGCGARSSAAETVAVPRLPTTTAAAALAARIAGSKPAPAASIDRQHRDHRVAGARHVAHLDRIGRHVHRPRRAPA